MNSISCLTDKLKTLSSEPAIYWQEHVISYTDLQAKIAEKEDRLVTDGICSTTVALVADFSPASIAWLIALWKLGNTVALLMPRSQSQQIRLIETSQSAWVIELDGLGSALVTATGIKASDPALSSLISRSQAGLVILSSGSTGAPKASLHDVEALLSEHVLRRRILRTIAFLLFDHIGGINTLLYVLSNGGSLVIPSERKPYPVAKAISDFKVQAISTSPTFINLLLLSGAAEVYDLSSLEVINYSTEPMPQATLERLHALLPNTRISQSYGLTEVGVIPTKSESSSSTWMRIGKDNESVRIIDGIIEIKRPRSMLGYIGIKTDFTEDGYFRTGDAAIRQGNHIKILGRESEIINVGGEKVYPAEVEEILRDAGNIEEVIVFGEPNPILGSLVTAKFSLIKAEPESEFKSRISYYCKKMLLPYQIPRKIFISEEPLHSARFKKKRR